MDLLRKFNEYKDKVINNDKDFFNNLKNGQSPETLFITCSDSRILPNHVTGTKEGELFVIRNAGNAVTAYDNKSDLATSATVEYAVCALEVKNIIVCGHAHCGAVGARTNQKDVPGEWKCLHSYLDTMPEFSGDDIDENIKENVRCQLENLMSFPYIKERVEAGKLNLIGWVYHFDEGVVEVNSYPSREFVNWRTLL